MGVLCNPLRKGGGAFTRTTVCAVFDAGARAWEAFVLPLNYARKSAHFTPVSDDLSKGVGQGWRPVPVIICEGKMDNVSILHAIRSLAAAHPQLATTKADGTEPARGVALCLAARILISDGKLRVGECVYSNTSCQSAGEKESAQLT